MSPRAKWMIFSVFVMQLFIGVTLEAVFAGAGLRIVRLGIMTGCIFVGLRMAYPAMLKHASGRNANEETAGGAFVYRFFMSGTAGVAAGCSSGLAIAFMLMQAQH